MIRRLSQELGWNLREEQIQHYAAVLSPHFSKSQSDVTLRTIVTNYHLDHAAVEALMQANHQQHLAQWNDWMSAVLRILSREGLNWTTDPAITSDDLAQIALMELAHSIHSFHYHSRFSTWAYGVIVRSVQRSIRDSRALKRAQRPDSLDQLTDSEALIRFEDHPETIGVAQLLVEQALAILAAQPDQRLKDIFELWAIEDTKVDEIGKLFKLHPSRIRALLQQARQMLREHPTIQTWQPDK
jgi:RNA polymerase sigma factor (sigma-70 family)